MIQNRNIAPGAGIDPSKILGYGGMFGTTDYFHVAPVASQYYDWLRKTVPSDRLFTTLALAHVAMTADRGDTALVYPGAYTQSTTALTWSKDQCHIIGVGPKHFMMHPTVLQNGNADATPTGGNYVFSANECYISNIRLRHLGAAANVVNASITGDNLIFDNVHFHNMANTATADEAGMKGVVLDGASQPQFHNCMFGGNDIERTDGAAELTIGAGTCDNILLKDCIWLANLDAAADADHACIETVADADLGSFMYILNPLMVNCGLAAAVPDALSVGASVAGEIIIRNPMLVGYTDIADNEEKVWIISEKDTTPGKFHGIAINTDVT